MKAKTDIEKMTKPKLQQALRTIVEENKNCFDKIASYVMRVRDLEAINERRENDILQKNARLELAEEQIKAEREEARGTIGSLKADLVKQAELNSSLFKVVELLK